MMRALIVLVLLQFRISDLFRVVESSFSLLAANISALLFSAHENNSDDESCAAKSLLDR